MNLFGTLLGILFALVIKTVAEEEILDTATTTEGPEQPDPKDVGSLITFIRKELGKVESIQIKRDEPIENIYKHYDIANNHIDTLTMLVKSEDEAKKFNTQHGIDRIIMPNLSTDHNELKVKLLILIDTLLASQPAIIPELPHNLADKIVKSFLNSFDSDEKQVALDILCKMLPKNPIAQTRLMKVAGLTPFYKHMKTERPEVVKQMIELFNQMVEEHLEVRKLEDQGGVVNDDFIIYRRIGLIERLASTPDVCNGLFDVISNIWLPDSANRDPVLTAPIFKLLAVIKDFCLPIYRIKSFPIKLFQNMLDTMKSSFAEDKLRLMYKDFNQIIQLLTEYADMSKVKQLKTDEL